MSVIIKSLPDMTVTITENNNLNTDGQIYPIQVSCKGEHLCHKCFEVHKCIPCIGEIYLNNRTTVQDMSVKFHVINCPKFGKIVPKESLRASNV